jgi:hypothetical protein
MGENKTYSVNEIRRIREACRVFGVEIFALDLLCEGLTIEQAKLRLATIHDELKDKSDQRDLNNMNGFKHGVPGEELSRGIVKGAKNKSS